MSTQLRPPVEAAAPAPPPVEVTLDLQHNLYFEQGEIKISAAGQRVLLGLANRLKEDRREAVTLIGHTADHGSAEFNIALGAQRVEAVAQALERLGVSARQIRRISYGNVARAPSSCLSESCRQSERRVELVIGE